MTVRGITPQALADLFRASMRIAPASVSLVTARGADGGRVPARSIGGKSLSVLRGTLSSQIVPPRWPTITAPTQFSSGESTTWCLKSLHRTYRRSSGRAPLAATCKT
jgi:hypothetical protein